MKNSKPKKTSDATKKSIPSKHGAIEREKSMDADVVMPYNSYMVLRNGTKIISDFIDGFDYPDILLKESGKGATECKVDLKRHMLFIKTTFELFDEALQECDLER